MCSINFSNTSNNFRDMVTKVASDNVISQDEIKDLGNIATSEEDKNFVNTLQSNANFQDLKISSFDPAKSTLSFDLPEKLVQATSDNSVQPDQSDKEPVDNSKANNIKQNQKQQTPEAERVNLITPLIAAIGSIVGGLSGAAYNEELNSAVTNSLKTASNSINKHGTNTPIIGKFEPEVDEVERSKKLAEGKA